MTLFPQLSNFLFSARHRRGLSRFKFGFAAARLLESNRTFTLMNLIGSVSKTGVSHAQQHDCSGPCLLNRIDRQCEYEKCSFKPLIVKVKAHRAIDRAAVQLVSSWLGGIRRLAMYFATLDCAT